MILFHGTNGSLNIKDKYKSSRKKGSFEDGPGLYCTNRLYRAQNYGRKTIALDIELDPKFNADNVMLTFEDAAYFVYCNMTKKFYNEFVNEFKNKGEFSARRFIIYILNYSRKMHLISQELNEFLCKHNVKFSTDNFDLVVVYDFSIIKKQLTLSEVNYESDYSPGNKEVYHGT